MKQVCHSPFKLWFPFCVSFQWVLMFMFRRPSDLFPASPWFMDIFPQDDLRCIMFWWHILQCADEVKDGAWLKIWKDISFKCRKGCECLPHVDTAARKINIQTYFLFMLIDTKLLYYLIYTFLHRENPGLLDCLLFCVVTISWIHWLCMISFLSESIILLFLPCFASSVFHVCW